MHRGVAWTGGSRPPSIEQLKKRLERERMARSHAELIAERSTRELYAREKALELLEVIAVASNEATSIEHAMQIALDRVCDYTGWPVGHALILAEDGSGELVTTKMWHLEDVERFQVFRRVTESYRFPPGIGLPGRVLASGKPVWIVDVMRDSNFPRAKLVIDIGVHAGFGFPVLVGAEVVAVLEFFAVDPREPDARLLELMAHIGTQLGRVIERVRAARRLEGALEQALESSRLKSSFLANMSHEIRTPLNVILGYQSLITDHLVSLGDESQSHLFAGIERAARRLMDTVHSVLDLAKIESGGLRVAPVVLDPASKIAKLAENLQSRAREKGLSFTVELCDPNARVRFDEYCFDAALERVFDNAVKFTEKGSVSIVLERDGEGCLCLEVRDTGLGIAEGYRARLFEPFSQEDDGSDRHFEGSGLGLALAKRYLELNGATISVESVKGRGSVFRIRFSRSSEVSEVETGLGGKAPEGADPTEPATRPAVLVVEDDGDTQHYMRALLKSEYEVLLASSADEARRRLSEDPGRIHIILMDLSLKGPEDGLMLTRELRAQERWKQVSIIATTAHAFADDRRRALDAGCDAYFAKPFDHKALLSLMRELT